MRAPAWHHQDMQDCLVHAWVQYKSHLTHGNKGEDAERDDATTWVETIRASAYEQGRRDGLRAGFGG